MIEEQLGNVFFIKNVTFIYNKFWIQQPTFISATHLLTKYLIPYQTISQTNITLLKLVLKICLLAELVIKFLNQ